MDGDSLGLLAGLVKDADANFSWYNGQVLRPRFKDPLYPLLFGMIVGSGYLLWRLY